MQMKWDQEIPGSREAALELEWLETNGLGGYASSSLLNCHTRKYHGLLVANLDYPPGRYVLLSKVEDSLAAGTEEIFLSCHQYPGTFFPPEFPLKFLSLKAIFVSPPLIADSQYFKNKIV